MRSSAASSGGQEPAPRWRSWQPHSETITPFTCRGIVCGASTIAPRRPAQGGRHGAVPRAPARLGEALPQRRALHLVGRGLAVLVGAAAELVPGEVVVA